MVSASAPRLSSIPVSRPPSSVPAVPAVRTHASHASSYLQRYDKAVYTEPMCVSSSVGAPVWCNDFGTGQECRSCWLSCDGARTYASEFPGFDPDT